MSAAWLHLRLCGRESVDNVICTRINLWVCRSVLARQRGGGGRGGAGVICVTSRLLRLVLDAARPHSRSNTMLYTYVCITAVVWSVHFMCDLSPRTAAALYGTARRSQRHMLSMPLHCVRSARHSLTTKRQLGLMHFSESCPSSVWP